jgi:hypothetical protein
VIGAGTEWQWGGGWSIRSEFLYMTFQKDERTVTSCCFDPGEAKSFTNLDSIWTSRIGLTYRWGGDLPIAAKY